MTNSPSADPFSPFGPLIIAGVVAAIVALVGLWANRKLGLNPANDRLVETLQKTMQAQEKRLTLLESENQTLRDRIEYLEQRQRDLEDENSRLRSRQRAVRRSPSNDAD